MADDVRVQLSEADRLVIIPSDKGRSITEEYDWPEPVGGGSPVKRATRKPKRARLGTQEGRPWLTIRDAS